MSVASPISAVPSASAFRVDVVPVRDLVDFARRALARGPAGGILPIVPHLAEAHANNPYADPDDPGLLVAFVGEECAGHIALVPGRVRLADRMSKVFWGSALFVSEAHRQLGVGATLIHRLLSLDIDFVGAEMSRKAERMWRLIGLTKLLGPRTVYTVQLGRAKGTAWRTAGSRWTKHFRRLTSVALDACYPLSRALIYLSLTRRFRRSLATVVVSEVQRLPDEFDEDHAPATAPAPDNAVAFHRGLDWINWKLSYPWVLRDDQVPAEVRDAEERYYFEVSRPLFLQRAFTFRARGSGAPLGFLVVSISARHQRETRLKVLDASRGLEPDLALAVAVRVAREHHADAIVLSEKLGLRLQATWQGRWLLEKGIHEYICRPRRGGNFATHVDRLQLDLCDGDYSFT